MSMVREERRESFNIREGDIFRIRAGTTAYLVNKGNSERLVLAKLLVPVNTPGNFEVQNKIKHCLGVFMFTIYILYTTVCKCLILIKK